MGLRKQLAVMGAKSESKYFGSLDQPAIQTSTLQPLYNMVCYNMALDITQTKDGSQKCIDYIEK